jgi:UDP-N-acetylglucosamine 2-epimerase
MMLFSLGTRPDIIKMAAVIEEAKRRGVEFVLVHTGQHYDWEMSKSFFKELKLPDPDYNLGVRSGSHGEQTAKIIVRFEKVLTKEGPDIVVVDGDTNSAMGCSIAATKLKIPVGHVEAGCRSFDKTMPEEINRIIISDLAKVHFAPTRNCVSNLLSEGIEKKSIFLTGHPLVDLLEKLKPKIGTKITNQYRISPRGFYVITLHRDFNTDNKDRLKEILVALREIATKKPVIFPIHPRTRKMIREFGLQSLLGNITTLEPVGYLEMLDLIKNARAVLTDSGGIQQEAAILGTPCMTLRENTEWIETLSSSSNVLVGASLKKITETTRRLDNKYEAALKNMKNKHIFGKKGASKRIISLIVKSVNSDKT